MARRRLLAPAGEDLPALVQQSRAKGDVHPAAPRDLRAREEVQRHAVQPQFDAGFRRESRGEAAPRVLCCFRRPRDRPSLHLQPGIDIGPPPTPRQGRARPAARCFLCYARGMSLATLTQLRHGALAGARELRLPGCGLTALPPEVFGLAGTLELLDLSDNALTQLPEDFGRLTRLRVLFCSGNRFDRLPPVLGDCPALSQVGFRATGLSEVPAEALPPRLRWLTLTDNHITSLPAALGERPELAKLMLAGNALQHLPESLASAPALELLRLSANRFAAPPSWLAAHPRLAWLGLAGNGFDRMEAPATAQVPWPALALGALLGQGASGLVHHAQWQEAADAPPREVALKLFKGAMTSDGLPRHEMAACLAAGGHPALMGAIGRLHGHPEGLEGLVMPLLPPDWRVLAGPPSLASCTRDVYAAELRLSAPAALRIARDVADALAHLHGRGVLHGDVYAHNILWDGATGAAMLSDFGAACLLPPEAAAPLSALERRAFGLLAGELLALVPAAEPGLAPLRAVEAACLDPTPARRPPMAEIRRALG